MIRTIKARPEHAPQIASLVMTAMTDECCQNLAGEGNTLADFARLISSLAAADVSQYSYRNTIVAVDDGGKVCGAVVSYDGGRLLELRHPFIDGAARLLGRDMSGMDEETAAGEWYIDSLAVVPSERGKGIAHQLLEGAIRRARQAGLPAALLVDKGNPRAERLYRSLGFEHAGDTTWGGHEMRHLVRPLDSDGATKPNKQ